MKKQSWEHFFSSFERQAELVDRIPEMDFPDSRHVPADKQVLIEETKLCCMMGMLLCLDRSQRLVFILGAVFEANSAIGAEILEISPENFRQKLSRARKQLSNFMNEKCGLMNTKNPCRCVRKTRGLIRAGYIDPKGLRFQRHYVSKVKALVAARAHKIDDVLSLRSQILFQDHPFLESPNATQFLKDLLQRREFQTILNFHDYEQTTSQSRRTFLHASSNN
jgi:hypothetical protein